MAALLLLEDPLLSDLLPVIKTAAGNIQKPQEFKSKNILEIVSEEDVQMRILAEQGSALRLTIKRGDGSSIGAGSPDLDIFFAVLYVNVQDFSFTIV